MSCDYCRPNTEKGCLCCGYKNNGGASEWISVEDRLPEDRGQYLVFYVIEGTEYSGRTVCDFLLGSLWVAQHNATVTHWMPLPEPPNL